MFNTAVFSAVIFLAGVTQAQAATLSLGSDSNTIKTKSHSIETEYSRDMRKSQPPVDVDNLPHQGALEVEEASSGYDVVPNAGQAPVRSSYSGVNSFSYPSTLKMRDDRKVGVGFSAGGSMGAAAINLELNFEDADGAIAGVGMGPGYNTVQLAWKHAFEGDYLGPYTTLGYSRWYNSRGRGDEYSKSPILDRLLTENEKKEGRFGTDFVNGTLGLQYNQLAGDFAGLSVFAELTAMFEIKRAMLLPNGAMGVIYYF